MATCLTSGLHRAASKSDKLPHSGPANVTGPEGWQWAAGCVPGLRCAGRGTAAASLEGDWASLAFPQARSCPSQSVFYA